MDQRTLPQPIPLAKKIKGKFIEIEKIKKDSGFAWELEHKETGEVVGVVDPSTKSDCQRNGLTYVNSACHLFQQNIVAVLYRRKIWYRVVQPIALGDELLTHYGGSYSKILGISRVCAVGMREHVGLDSTWQRKKKKNQTPAPPITAPPNRKN